MKIRVQRIEDGPARVEVIDPSDGALANSVDVNVGEEVTIVATTAHSPADIEVGEVVPNNPQDSAPAEDAPDTAEPDADAGEDGGSENQKATAPVDPTDPAAGGEEPEDAAA